MSGPSFFGGPAFLGAIHIPALGAVRDAEVEVVRSQCVLSLLTAGEGVKSSVEVKVGRAAVREVDFLKGEPVIDRKSVV